MKPTEKITPSGLETERKNIKKVKGKLYILSEFNLLTIKKQRSKMKMNNISSNPDTAHKINGRLKSIRQTAGRNNPDIPDSLQILKRQMRLKRTKISPVILADNSRGRPITLNKESNINQLKLENPSTCTPLLNTIPSPFVKLFTYRK